MKITTDIQTIPAQTTKIPREVPSSCGTIEYTLCDGALMFRSVGSLYKGWVRCYTVDSADFAIVADLYAKPYEEQEVAPAKTTATLTMELTEQDLSFLRELNAAMGTMNTGYDLYEAIGKIRQALAQWNAKK